jgi:hypothetical protein
MGVRIAFFSFFLFPARPSYAQGSSPGGASSLHAGDGVTRSCASTAGQRTHCDATTRWASLARRLKKLRVCSATWGYDDTGV